MTLRLVSAAKAAQTAKTYLLKEYQEFPNSSQHGLPLVIFRPFANGDGDGSSLDPNQVEKLLGSNGLQAAWRYGMYPFDHYHSNTHEVLVPYSGTAELAFGHSESPSCIHHTARAGDVYIVPAGVVHRSMSQSSDFQMVGSYPVDGVDWDNCRGGKSEQTSKLWERVKELGRKENRLELDPVYGEDKDAPLFQLWK